MWQWLKRLRKHNGGTVRIEEHAERKAEAERRLAEARRRYVKVEADLRKRI